MRHTFTIDSIFEGHQPSFYAGQAGQFLDSIGIDPDVPLTDDSTDLKASGALRPVAYRQFSGAEIDAAPISIITTPKNTLTYVILTNGKLVSYTSALTSAGATSIGQVSGNAARGGWYYNNYIYIAKPTDLSRYGPLDNSPTLTNNVWTGATLGSQTALTDTTYPVTALSHSYLNHTGFVHVDNRAYFLDYKNGIGMVHYVKTTRVTNEGDTNDASSYNFLDLPFNMIPITIGPYGLDIVIAATPTTSSSINQGNAVLFFANPADTTPSFYRAVRLPDPICTALWYENGTLFGISGDLNKGQRLWRYVGGDAIQTLKFIEDGNPPPQGATSAYGNRIVWGDFTTQPFKSSGVMAYGSKSDLFPRGLHRIAVTDFT